MLSCFAPIGCGTICGHVMVLMVRIIFNLITIKRLHCYFNTRKDELRTTIKAANVLKVPSTTELKLIDMQMMNKSIKPYFEFFL